MPAINIAGENEHQYNSGHHDFVGNWIKKDPQLGYRSLRPGKVAVEIIGNAHQAV